MPLMSGRLMSSRTISDAVFDLLQSLLTLRRFGYDLKVWICAQNGPQGAARNLVIIDKHDSNQRHHLSMGRPWSFQR